MPRVTTRGGAALAAVLLLASGCDLLPGSAERIPDNVSEIPAIVETEPGRNPGAAADDPAIWIHPEDAGAVGEQVLVVDNGHAGASDGKRGTLDAPFATIQAALDAATQLNVAGEGVRVRVRPGIYREALDLRGGSARTDAPLVIEGDGAAQVVVDGADVWTEWEPSSQVAGAWTTYWPYEWGLAAVPSGWGDVLARRGEVLRRREVVWVNGTVMRQVLQPEDLAPGTFLVDESSKSLTVLPAQGVSVDEANVEVAVRGHGLRVEGWRNLTLRGMTFRRAATSLQQAGVRFADTADVLVEDVRSEQHNWGGLAVQNSQGVTLRRVALTGNGVLGLSVWRSEGLRVIDVDNSYNNTWRGPWAGHYGWEAGSKVFRARDIIFDGWRAVGNESYGLWLDTDVSDAVIRDSFIADNRRGLFLEAMQGPVTVENTTICNNRGAGILDGKADGVTLEGNRIFGNRGAQLQFSGEPGGRAFTTYDRGEHLLVRSTGWTMRNNVLEGGEGARVIGNHLNAEDWALVRDSLHAGANRYHHASDARPFTISAAIVDFAGWRADVGTDADSTFSTDETGLHCKADLPPVPEQPQDEDDPISAPAPSEPEEDEGDPISAPAPSEPEEDGGDPLAGCTALAGDWNRSGRSGIGWWCDGKTKLRTSSGNVITYNYGRAGDVPVVADWNGNGQDTVSVIRDGTWHVNNSLSGGASERTFHYGRVTRGDVPIAGDWNRGGFDLPGIVRDREWHLRAKQSGGDADWSFIYGRLTRGDLPLWGDWNRDRRDTVGIVRDGTWHLRNVHAGGASDIAFIYGRVLTGDLPVVGDWTGDRIDTPGIVRDGEWHLRYENKGGAADRVITFPSP